MNAIDAVSALPAELRVRLVIVGDGPARAELDALAASANARCGRTVATLVGAADDPRPWYAAADVVLGMGSSALRAMAYAKPLVVQGERGFWRAARRRQPRRLPAPGLVRRRGRRRRRRPARGPSCGSWPRSRGDVRSSAGSPPRWCGSGSASSTSTDRLEGIYADALEHRPRRTSALRHGARPAGQLWCTRPAGASPGCATVRSPRTSMPSQPSPGTRRRGAHMSDAIPLVDVAATQAAVLEEVQPLVARDPRNAARSWGAPRRRLRGGVRRRSSGARHCVGVANGTDALEIALRAVGVRRRRRGRAAGQHVRRHRRGGRPGSVRGPVLVDCDDDYLLIDPDAGRRGGHRPHRGRRPGAPLRPARAGRAARAAVGLRRLAIVEDAAQSQGAPAHGAGAGDARAVAATSFYPGKNLGAYGDAGAVITDDAEIARRCRLLGNHGSETKYEPRGARLQLPARRAPGRGAARQAARASTPWNEARRARGRAVRRRCSPTLADVVLPRDPRGQRARVAPLRRPGRRSATGCWRTCNAAGIGAGIHYPIPVHLQRRRSRTWATAAATSRSPRPRPTAMISLPIDARSSGPTSRSGSP